MYQSNFISNLLGLNNIPICFISILVVVFIPPVDCSFSIKLAIPAFLYVCKIFQKGKFKEMTFNPPIFKPILNSNIRDITIMCLTYFPIPFVIFFATCRSLRRAYLWRMNL